MKNKRRPFSESEIMQIQRDYRDCVDRGTLGALAQYMGRTKASLCRKAGELGLTDAAAARKAAADIAGDKRRGTKMWAEKPHPRGFAGKTHGATARANISRGTTAGLAMMTPEAESDRVRNILQTRFDKHGTRAPVAPRGSWKAGWREIGAHRKYYRSRWEANYARYLQWLMDRGDIKDWRHEPETFWFEAIRRGVRSYLPDFRVWENDGSSRLHEVKGWMDDRSRTTLKRMAKYHPQETIIVVAEKQYREVERKVSALIEGWE